MKNRVKFFEVGRSGPEVGESYNEVYECFCDDYEPTTRDQTALDAPGGRKSVTVTIRNAYQEFKPAHHHIFELQSGYFQGTKFNVKNIAPYTDNPQYLKIIGEGVS
jgi:hypothetical protein